MTLTTGAGWLATFGDTADPTPDYVLRFAARSFGVSMAALTSPSRTHPLVQYRQVAMAAMHALTGEGHAKVARRFGKDHATVAHAIERCQEVERLGRALEALVAACRRQWAIDNGLADQC